MHNGPDSSSFCSAPSGSTVAGGGSRRAFALPFFEAVDDAAAFSSLALALFSRALKRDGAGSAIEGLLGDVEVDGSGCMT